MTGLEPSTAAYLAGRSDGPPAESLSLAQLRAQAPAPGALRRIGIVESASVPVRGGERLGVRIHRPESSAPGPVILYFHGGGWVRGSSVHAAAITHELCAELSATVASVDYRLAPENRFPAQIDDAWASLEWALAGSSELGGDGRVVVAGDSAGGTLAAATAIRARDRGVSGVAHQLLLYPVMDHAFDTGSYRAYASGFGLSRALMQRFWSLYLAQSGDGADPLASPLRAGRLSGLPAATIVTAEYDPLRDEGEAYAARLRQDGVPVELMRYAGTIHGFCGQMGSIPLGREAIRAAAANIRRDLGVGDGRRAAERAEEMRQR